MTMKTGYAFILGLVLLALMSGLAMAQGRPQAVDSCGPVYVSEPVVPTITPAVRDLPDWKPDPNAFKLEMKRREDYGFIPIEYPHEPKVDSLMQLHGLEGTPQPSGFSTLIHNYDGESSSVSPPDENGDVGLNHYVQMTNQSTSTARVINKSSGANMKTFAIQSLASGSPCNNGFCDPVVLYDRMADRWILTELPGADASVCVYVSTSGDPTGTYYAYSFAVDGSVDYPKYGVWPQNGNGGSYLAGLNASHTSGYWDLCAFDRAKMLAGQPATFQEFSVAGLANSGFQLVLPSTMEGNTPPPNGEPAIFARPHDDEAEDGANTPTYDLMDMWALSVDWTTPANSHLTTLTPLHIADYDMTLCGMGGDWNCMPQPNTSQKIDPIREPLHFPFQYRNFGDHQTLVGCFVEDVDGTDHAAMRWFELRKTGAGAWSVYQEGVVGGEANVHRSVGSIGMDGSGNMAIGYTRTGSNAPYYPSIYYKGRLSTDTLGTMPQGEYTIVDATTSNTDNERWGDYSGMGVDPADDCTFWYTTEYGGAGAIKVAAFKFDQCGCLAAPAAPTASATVPQDNRIDLGWDDSATTSITQYYVFRSMTAGGPYTQIATIPDSSPGVGGGAGYTYHDDTVSGGTRYYYVVKSNDGAACTSDYSSEVNALATGLCLLAPTFAGIASVADAHNAACTLNLSWGPGASACSTALTYNVYRSTTSSFTPAPANQIASGLSGTSYSDSLGLSNGTPYYYIVRAVDSVSGVEEVNTTVQSGVPRGPIVFSTWTDTFEGAQSGGGFDQAGWTHKAVSGATNWTWTTAQHNDGTHSWFAQDTASTSDMVLVSPAFGVGPGTNLTFYHTYKFQGTTSLCYDGGTLEYSTDGTTWTVVPDADFVTGGFTGTIYAYLMNPIKRKRAWCGGTLGAMTQVNVNLGGDPNLLLKTIQVRWHEGNDAITASTGWYLDTVAVTNAQTVSACANFCAGNPTSVDVTPDGPLTLCAGSGQLLTASATGGSGLTYQWTQDGNSIGGATSTTYAANDTGAHAYNCQVMGAGCPAPMFDATPTSITWQAAPSFGGLSSVTNPQSAGCALNLSWSAADSVCPGSVTYKVFRSTTHPVSPVPGNLIASGVTATSYADSAGLVSGTLYYYIVHAVDGAGHEDANAVERSAAPTGTINSSTLLTESFDSTTFPPTGWNQLDVMGTAGNWARSTATVNPTGGTTHSGAGLAYFNSHTTMLRESTRLYRTSGVSLVGATSASVTFWMYHDMGYPTSNDRVQLQVSTRSGLSWSNVGSAVPRYNGSTGWAQHTVDISAVVGQADVRIAFQGLSGHGNDCHIDDVTVTKMSVTPCTTQ